MPDGHYDLRILITDNADNVTTTDLPDKVVDNTAPDVATRRRADRGPASSAAPSESPRRPPTRPRRSPRSSSTSADRSSARTRLRRSRMNWNTTTGADGGATIQVVVEDMAGNSTTSALRNVSVDNVSPTPTLADPGQNLNGTVSLSASSDAGHDSGRLRAADRRRRLMGHDRERHDDAVGHVARHDDARRRSLRLPRNRDRRDRSHRHEPDPREHPRRQHHLLPGR